MNKSKYPSHDHQFFFKYTSASTALKILKNRSFRYSSPLEFNDPFDVQTEISFDFGIDELPKIVMAEIKNIVQSPHQCPIKSDNEWSKAILLLREKVQKHGYKQQEVESLFLPFLEFLKTIIADIRGQYNRTWQSFVPRLRVFSVSTVKDEILMWSHYAKNHTGVVFKLAVLPELDNPLCAAGPIIYKKTPPVFFKIEDWITELVGIKEIDHEKLYWEYAYTKSEIWAYEQEWRVWDLLPEAKPELFSDYPIYPQELSAIYFGCKTEKEAKKEIISLAKEINKEVRFFQVDKIPDEYKLYCNEI